MQIVCKETTEWSKGEWDSYTHSFNAVFEKSFTKHDFEHKYILSVDGTSYHALLLHEESVVGGCTAIPFEYHLKDQMIRVGLAVDVFITEEHRTDSLALFSMYRKLKSLLVKKGISLLVAVPNDVAYPFWKSIVKWKDVDYLGYYALPVRLGNMLSKAPFLFNILSRIGTTILLSISLIFRSHAQEKPIRINREIAVIEKHRYTKEHKKITIGDHFFSYRIMNENRIETCYLIDFYHGEAKIKKSGTLTKAIRHIIKYEKPDVIIYIGDLSLIQILLFKVPFKLEPRHLYFMADVLGKGDHFAELDIYEYKNWDFGLFNFDVR